MLPRVPDRPRPHRRRGHRPDHRHLRQRVAHEPAVARRLDCAQISTRVVDMRWLAPLPIQDIVREANATGRVFVVDETRSSGGVAESVVTALVDVGFTGPLARVASFIPLDDARTGSAAVRKHHRGRCDQTHPGEPMRYTVRFGDLAFPDPWAEEWNGR
jgi:transketolase-like protein